MITNCASSGADSTANPLTGVVTRKDKTTGATIPAAIRPTSGESIADKPAASHSAEASLSGSALSAVLSFQK